MNPSLRLSINPGDDRLPITRGRISDFTDDAVSCLRGLWARHGHVAALEEGVQRIYFVFGPEYNKQVLSDAERFHSRFFAVRGAKNSAQRRLSSGLLSMNGDEHKRHRRITMQPFAKTSITSYHDAVVHLADEMLDAWQPGETRNIDQEMTEYMLRLTSSVLFGLDAHDLAIEIGRKTERWVALNHEIGPAAFVPNPDLTDKYEELLEAAEELERPIREMLRLRRLNTDGTDVLSLLIQAHNGEGGISDDQLIGQIALLFGAAHLTSAHTLTWTLFLLSQHPEVMRELHAELSEQTEGNSPRPDQLDTLNVLDRVLKESMRVLPASAYSQRITSQPVELGPFQLPPGAVVIFSQFMSHHLPEMYDEPESFRPDRWKTISPSPYAYLPFGAGPRMCIGAALGMMQLKITLPTILGRYKLSLEDGADVNAQVMSTMLFPTSRVPMKISLQDGQFTTPSVIGNIHSLVNLPPASSPLRRAA
ncbi:MAG: cytochrome P450 [Planctomycetaceae bacterium]|nr:cytochrome P450 [Planctomycetaceae bacterium]